MSKTTTCLQWQVCSSQGRIILCRNKPKSSIYDGVGRSHLYWSDSHYFHTRGCQYQPACLPGDLLNSRTTSWSRRPMIILTINHGHYRNTPLHLIKPRSLKPGVRNIVRTQLDQAVSLLAGSQPHGICHGMCHTGPYWRPRVFPKPHLTIESSRRMWSGNGPDSTWALVTIQRELPTSSQAQHSDEKMLIQTKS